MKCPVDQTQLTISERQGVEIDFCPTCRGVWLDRGELDKLIERMQSYMGGRDHDRRDSRDYDDRRDRDYHDRGEYDRRRHDDDDDDDHYRNDHHKKHKKEGFLGDLFDFG